MLVAGAALATAAGVAACGGGSSGQTNQTAAERFAAILDHQPTGLAATVAQRGTLVVGEDPGFAPQSSVDSAGAWNGFDVDVARRVAAVLGLKVEFRQLDWARIPAALAADRYDVAISSIATDPAPTG
ncbi:MAG: substrate-binding periplasmic protein, partial [Thermoleophilia bacterium]